MSMNWAIDSPSLYVTSSAVSTPVRRSSQNSYVNTPVDSVVPRTPSITNHQYSIDQCVPHTPATLAIAISSPNSTTVPGTPLNNLNATSPSRYSILYFDNQDDDPASVASIDQTVPSTPTSNAREPYIQGNCDDHSSHSSPAVNRNSDSCMGDQFPSRNTVAQSNVTKHQRSTTRKQLSLKKSNNTITSTMTTHQTLPSNNTSETQGNCSNSNTTVELSIPECSSRPTKETCDASSEVSTPVDHSLLLHSTNEPAATLTCSPYLLPSDSLTTRTVRRPSVSPEVPVIHITDTRHVQRQFAHTGETSHFQGGNGTLPHNSTQLQLFDGDDIFQSFL